MSFPKPVCHKYGDFQGNQRNNWIFPSEFLQESIFSFRAFIEFIYDFSIYQILFSLHQRDYRIIHPVVYLKMEFPLSQISFKFFSLPFFFLQTLASSSSSIYTYGRGASRYFLFMIYFFVCLALRRIYASQLRLIARCSPLQFTHLAGLFAALVRWPSKHFKQLG